MVRRFFRSLATLFFLLFLVVTTLAVVTFMVFGKPDGLKQSLESSGIYNSIVGNSLEALSEELAKKPGTEASDLPTNRPEIRQAAEDALPPETIQDAADQFIDGMYGWIRGETERPEFRIDLTQSKQTFAVKVAAYAEKRYKKLPVCTPTQLRTMDQNADPLSVKCRSPALSATKVKQKVFDTLIDDDFLGVPVITGNKLFTDKDGNFTQAANVPNQFKILRFLPALSGVLLLISGVIMLLLHEEKLKGVRTIALCLIGTGIFLLLNSWLIASLLGNLSQPEGAIARAAPERFRDSAVAIVKNLNATFNTTLVKFTIIYVILGIGTLITLHLINKRQAQHYHK